MNRFMVKAHLPPNSADAQWHIVDTAEDDNIVAIVDPDSIYANPEDLAGEICNAMNTCKVLD